MTDGKAVKAIADELALLLKDQPHLAEFIDQLGRSANGGLEAAAPFYRSAELWGGFGSLADEGGALLPPRERGRVAELLVALFSQFQDAGIQYDRAASWADTFHYWLDSKVLQGSARS
jgi:hypothetical protein